MRLIDVDALGVGLCSRDVLPADYCAGWNGLIRLLEKAPTVDAVPVVHGRWQYNTKFYVWCCSECGENPHKGTGVVTTAEKLPAYCPNCGAKMDGAE